MGPPNEIATQPTKIDVRRNLATFRSNASTLSVSLSASVTALVSCYQKEPSVFMGVRLIAESTLLGRNPIERANYYLAFHG
jgi:hypothetical protein